MDDIMKIVTSLEGTGLLIKGVSKTIKNEAREQKGGTFSMLLVTLGDSLLAGIGTIATRAGKLTLRADEDTIRAGQDF